MDFNDLIREHAPDILKEVVVVFLGLVAGWFLLVRRKLRDLQRLQAGDSDDFIFQMHQLWPVPKKNGWFVLLFRNVVPNTTLNHLYDNPAARQLVKELADRTSLANPILQTEGREGFEILNTAIGHLAGSLASTPFNREVWLFAMTCEDRQVVRKKCIRCFLIRPEDLRRFLDWHWCHTKVCVERPSHWYRVVALHCIAQSWQQEQDRTRQAAKASSAATKAVPLVDRQKEHNRVVELSLGLNTNEIPVGQPSPVHWPELLPQLKKMGLALEAEEIQTEQAEAAGHAERKNPG